ncbi:type IV pilin protein [Pseudomonas sp. QL9]|uniref:Uncharacterized protein n=1 Tax=Pseudomonas knackmussii (strain DSM 6978 / CCUG 54928 / LMG 23759 / B13) TaxID=1301098 RepID=A0A024HMQ5_PSEKB|nr:type IV pilin protein [Pseudomonas knackmussii]CDF86116.1 hypothetical protein PKB_4796 [Pseudomonas knackmussii B13]
MNKQRGFTLLELMIAVVVVAILAAIALPNYTAYVRRTACEDVKGTLTGAAGLMERYRAQNNSYAGADLGAYAQSPVDSTAIFTISLENLTSTSYDLKASPVAGGVMAGKGELYLSSNGVRSGEAGTAMANAWSSCRGI